MKKIEVNKDTCIGCGACVAIDDTHFTFDSEGKSEVISQENLEDNNLVNAIESCPVAAIYLTDAKCNCDESCDCGCIEGQECTCDGGCECDDCNCGDDCNCDHECHCEGCGQN